MGLGLSHDAGHWSYSGFGGFRCFLAKIAGYNLRTIKYKISNTDHEVTQPDIDYNKYCDENFYGKWKAAERPKDPLLYLFVHSDCEGSIYLKELRLLLPRLEELYKQIENSNDFETKYHKDYLEGLIAGIKRAIKSKKPLEFH